MKSNTLTEFKIRFHSGLGDCFRMLSEQPAIDLHNKKHNIKIYYTYDTCTPMMFYNQYNPNTDLPMHLAVHDIFKNVEFFKAVGHEDFLNLEVPELDNWKCDYREEYQLRNIYENEHQGFDIPVSNLDLIILNNLLHSPVNIAIQFSGKDPVKNYSIANYLKLLKLILKKFPHCKIFLFDRPGKDIDTSLFFDNRIVNLTSVMSRTLLINLIQRVDYLISPDSYSKYVRNWANGKQTVIYSKLDYMSPLDSLKWTFGNYNDKISARLVYNPLVKILGVKYNDDLTSADCVQNLNDISPEEIVNSIDI